MPQGSTNPGTIMIHRFRLLVKRPHAPPSRKLLKEPNRQSSLSSPCGEPIDRSNISHRASTSKYPDSVDEYGKGLCCATLKHCGLLFLIFASIIVDSRDSWWLVDVLFRRWWFNFPSLPVYEAIANSAVR